MPEPEEVCPHCADFDARLDRLIHWLQQNEAGYAEKHLRLSRLVNMQPQAGTANTISRTLTLVLEQVDRIFPAQQKRTVGLLDRFKRLFFGAAG